MIFRVSQPCHLVETRPHQVRVTRVFAFLSARLGKHPSKAHLMRTGLDKMTRLGISARRDAVIFVLAGLRNLKPGIKGEYCRHLLRLPE